MSEGRKNYPSKMDSGMKSLLELLPGIDDFLINTLSKEKLSSSTEKKRLYYVERLDVLRLPPTLPPRPDGLTANGHSSSQPNINVSTDDFIAQQRELSQLITDENVETYDTVESPTPLAGVLEKFGLKEENNGRPEESLYEVPVGQHPAFSDGEYSTGTDYESYSEDEGAPVYQNEEFHDSKFKSRGKSRRSKKDKRNGGKVPEYEMVCAKFYPNAAYGGELYQKWKLGKWMKRYCILDKSGGFLCFKNERETKPVHMISNFATSYIGKEGKRNYVIKLAPPSSEALYFSGESKEISDNWMTAFNPSFPGIDQVDPQLVDETGKSTSNTNLSLSSSEGGSGDGVVNLGNQPQSGQLTSLSDKNKKKNSPSVMDSISSFFSMGRKKGDKTKRDLCMADIEERELDPEALVGGTINISSELFNHRRWLVRYCIIKQGSLICFKEDNEEVEFTLPLHGLEIDSSRDTKRQLAIRLSQEARERVIVDFSDSLEQGRWLSVLVKEIGLGEQGGVLAYQAVNDAIPSPTQVEDELDADIYDEPFEDKGQNGLARGRPGSDSLRSTSSNASNGSTSGNTTDSSKVPPPLPAVPPPANREVGHHGNTADDPDVIYEGDDEGYGQENDENHNYCEKFNVTGIKTSDGLPITEQIYQNTCVVTGDETSTSTSVTVSHGGCHGNELEPLEEESEYQNVGFARESLEFPAENNEQGRRSVSPRPVKQIDKAPEPIETVKDDTSVPNDANRQQQKQSKQQPKQQQPKQQQPKQQQQPRQQQQKQQHGAENEIKVTKTPSNKSVEKRTDKPAVKPAVEKSAPIKKPSEKTAEKVEEPHGESGNWDEWTDNEKSDVKDEAKSGTQTNAEDEGQKVVQEASEFQEHSQVASAQVERVRRTNSGRGAVTTGSGSVVGRRLMGQSTTPRRTPSFNSQESSDTDSQSSDIIKCHQGPTIDLDKDVLEQTENPILSEIRKSKTRISFRQSDKESLLDEIGNTRKKMATLRKKRAELRAKKLHCPDLRGKKDLEEQLKILQDEYLVAEKELEGLKDQLDEMENMFASKSKAKSLDRGTTPAEPVTEKRRSSNLSSSSFEKDRGSPRTRRSFTYRSEESSQQSASLSSSPSPGKSSCTVQFSAGVPTSTIAIRDYSKSTTTTGSTTRTVQESKVVVRTTSSSGSKVVTKTTTTSNGSSPEMHRRSKMIEIEGVKKAERDLLTPLGGRQKVQEKLKLWESLSSTSTC